MNWQPIDTAPKDGTRVLLYAPCRLGEDRIEVGRFNAHIPEIPEGRWYGGYWAMWPTHWMPLPDPPSPGATPEAGKA